MAKKKKDNARSTEMTFVEAKDRAKKARISRVINRLSDTASAPSLTFDKTKGGLQYEEKDMDRRSATVEASGSVNRAFSDRLFYELVNAVRSSDDCENELPAFNAALGAMAGIAPRDEAEAMLAAQMVATHHAAMDLIGKAKREKYLAPAEWRSSFAIKLMRTYTAQMEALQRYRGHGQQTVRVEHVTVNAGGQAIVGNVNPPGGGGAQQKTEDQPHATAIEYQPAPTMPPLRRKNTTREAVPIPGDAER